MQRAYAQSKAEEQQAEEEGLALRDQMRAAYPFHPALIDLMRERWAAIPDFQRTRGALRFLASCLRATKREERSRAVLGPGDVPIYDAEVRLAFFKEVGQQSDFQAVHGARPSSERTHARSALTSGAPRRTHPRQESDGIAAGDGDPDVFVRRHAARRRERHRDSPPGITEANCYRCASALTSTARRHWRA